MIMAIRIAQIPLLLRTIPIGSNFELVAKTSKHD